MRCRNQHSRIVLGNRPFAGGLGASLYIGPTETTINYRRYRICQYRRSAWWCVSRSMIDPGATTVPKCQAVAQVSSPTVELQYTLPVALRGTLQWYQVRTFEADYENESIYNPRSLETTGGGDDGSTILGTANIVKIQKRDNGAVRIGWIWSRSPDGIQPTSFVVVKTSGAGTVANVTTLVTALRSYECDVTGLTDGVAYTFSLRGVKGGTTVDLVTGIAFTGDAAGPPAVTGLVAVEV